MASIQQTPQGPVLVLKESALQQKGKDAQKNNIAAAKLVADLVKTSLGPRGLDKMLVDPIGDVTITNDGATILKEIDVQHPAAKMIVEKKSGASILDTALIKGIVLDKEIVHSGMPTKIERAKIALINAALEIEKTEMSAEIRISDPTQMQMFLEEENRMLKTMVEKIHEAGANVLICQKGIDDIAQHYLAKHGILAVRRVKESDMTKLAKATGGRVTTNIDDLTEKDLGYAELVHQKKVESDKWVFVEGCRNPQSVTLLIRGGSQRVVDEVD